MQNTQSITDSNIELDSLIESSQPFYLYKDPMFMVTVSVVVILENGVLMIKKESKESGENNTYQFPGGKINAGLETIQFSAIRQVKEQTGFSLKIEDLLPVDFRSDPERSNTKNIIDIGMVCMPDISHDFTLNNSTKLITVDFDSKQFETEINCYMDHSLLLERAISIALLMK